jgi:RimJ/RimL family protein N-acetyltransferase
MCFTNEYKLPAPTQVALTEDFGPDPYDINFCIPIDVSRLESERVKLVPFVPRLHANIYFNQIRQHPELEAYFSYTDKCLADTLSFCEAVRRDNTKVAFAAIDKGKPDPEHPEWGGSLAGTLRLNINTTNLKAEFAWIITFPAFQRTYVTSNATGILLRYCLATPNEKHPGLGLRRVQWCANARNAPSIEAAKRMGFKMEGQLRWERLVAVGWKSSGNGEPLRAGDPAPEKISRDSALLSFCADDWENGGRELVQSQIDRTVRCTPFHTSRLCILIFYR